MSDKEWEILPHRFCRGEQVYTPLWVDESFINGEPFFAIGTGPFGYGIVDPNLNRKILEGNFSSKIIQEVRQSARKFSLAVRDHAKEIIQNILRSPSSQERLLETINPYTFEEVVAELLRDNGFDVFLTPRTRDGGKDILAAYPYENTHLLMMVECKRRKTSNIVGPATVRAVLGQFYYEQLEQSGVECAMLVTTARRVGPLALAYQERVSHLSIKTFDDIMGWINEYGKMHKGLWIPNAFGQFF